MTRAVVKFPVNRTTKPQAWRAEPALVIMLPTIRIEHCQEPPAKPITVRKRRRLPSPFHGLKP